MKRIRTHHIVEKKQERSPIVMLTAYDALTAQIIDDVVDMILVGDSLGNVFNGYESTLPVTVEHIIYHSQAVTRSARRALVVADMPFMSYQVSEESAKTNAGRLIKEGGAQAVKMEVLPGQAHLVKSVVDMGVPVMGHIGFTPQFVDRLGGYKVQGRSDDGAAELNVLIKELESVGCFSVVLEMVPADVSQALTESVSIPTIGIGAGPYCDGQILVTEDCVGLSSGTPPSFVKAFGQVRDAMNAAVLAYRDAVVDRQFPDSDHSF